MLDLGAKPEHVTGNPEISVLSIAIEIGDRPLIRSLLDLGANVHQGGPVRLLTQAALSPLEVAAEKGFVDVIDLLIARGASPNYQSKSGTALSAAIREMQLEAVQALLRHGANPNQASPDAFFEKDFPPLLTWGWRAAEDTRSIRKTKLAILQTLLDAGANTAAPYTMRDTNGADLLELTAPIWAFMLIPSNHLGILKDVNGMLMPQSRTGLEHQISRRCKAVAR